jgi:hypothetical protein
MITHSKLGRLLSVLLMAAALSASAFGAALTTTTLTAAIPAANGNQQTVTVISVASNSGMVAQPTQPQSQGGLGGPFSGSVATFLYVDHELMSINNINSTFISVGRGVQGTVATSHNSGAVVYIATGRQLVPSNNNGNPPLSGSCNSAFQPPATPYIDIYTGNTWDCPSVGPYASTWVISGSTTGYQGSTTNLNPNTIQFVSIPLTAAQINTIYTTPIQILPAQGAGTLIEVQSCTLDLKYGSAAFTSGGTVTIGYGTTQSTVAASPGAATIASTVLTTFSASQAISVAGALAVTANSLTLNKALSITNGTGVFATGTGATAVLDCAYRVHNGF